MVSLLTCVYTPQLAGGRPLVSPVLPSPRDKTTLGVQTPAARGSPPSSMMWMCLALS